MSTSRWLAVLSLLAGASARAADDADSDTEAPPEATPAEPTEPTEPPPAEPPATEPPPATTSTDASAPVQTVTPTTETRHVTSTPAEQTQFVRPEAPPLEVLRATGDGARVTPAIAPEAPDTAPETNSTVGVVSPTVSEALKAPEQRVFDYTVGLELGYEWMIGSNAAAFADAPLARVVVGWRQTSLYDVVFTYGFSRHALVDPRALFASSIDNAEALSGHADLHELLAGARYSLLGEHPGRTALVPYLSSGGGVVAAASRLAFGGAVPAGGHTTWHLALELGAGASLEVGDRAAVSVGGRMLALPALRPTGVEVLWLATPSVSGSMSF